MQAQWWASARGAGVPPGQPLAWRAEWRAHSVDDESGAQKRIAIVRRASNGRWSATEWRWDPSPRAATRRWQEGRWKLLAAQADAFNAAAAADAVAPERDMLQSVWEHNLGTRAGEISGDVWRWQGDALCMRSDLIELAPSQFHIPYSVEDSRLEQRAAMQLQLARRFPKAQWPTPFRLVSGAAQARGGAKFLAVWLENSDLKGQLWIPTKGNGPLVRLRIHATLPPAPGAADSARAGQAMERELSALASRWSAVHE